MQHGSFELSDFQTRVFAWMSFPSWKLVVILNNLTKLNFAKTEGKTVKKLFKKGISTPLVNFDVQINYFP